MDDKKTQKVLNKLNEQVIHIKVPGFVLIDTINILRTSLQANARAVSFFNSVLEKSVELLSKEEPKEEIKEEHKEEIKEEHKEEIKEEPKDIQTTVSAYAVEPEAI